VPAAVDPSPKPKTQSSAAVSGIGGGPAKAMAQAVDVMAPITNIMAAAIKDGVSGARLATIVVTA